MTPHRTPVCELVPEPVTAVLTLVLVVTSPLRVLIFDKGKGWLPPSTDRNRSGKLHEPQSAPVGLLIMGTVSPALSEIVEKRRKMSNF